MNENKETHIIKVAILIKKINISVRFPCSLSFQLKTQSKSIDNTQLYSLVKGQCILNESLAIETKAEYNARTKRYSQCNIIVTVFMTSANGKIPAGNFCVTIKNEDFFSQAEQKCTLQKCPDRSAVVYIVKSANFLREATLTQISDRRSPYSSSQVGQSNQQDFTPTYQNKRNHLGRSNEETNSKLSRSGLKQQSYQRQYKLRIRKQQQSPHQSKSSYRVPNIAKDSLKQSKVSRSSSQLSQIVMQSQQQQLHQQKSKIMKLQKQKTQYIRQIAKIKGQLQLVQVSNEQIVQNQLGLLKEENLDLTEKLDQCKDKCRDLQRKQRQLQSTIKELNTVIQQKDIENKKLTKSQFVLDRKDKTIKQYQIKISKLQETIEELNSSIVTQQKRQQSKESSYKEQLKRMNQKYNQSQVERQKALFDLNKLLGEFETNEAKYRLQVKQRQKNHMIEKDGIYKKLNMFDQKFQEFMKDEQIYKRSIEELNQKIKLYETELDLKEDEIIKINEELSFTLSQSNKYKDIIKELQTDLEGFKNNRSEINDFRHKYQIVNQQLIKNKAKSESLETKCNQLESKNKDLQSSMKSKLLQNNEKEKKLRQLSKQISQLKKQQQKRMKQSQTLSAHNYNSSQKVAQLQKKLENEIQKNKELQQTHKNQLLFVMKQKQQLENQIEDYKWRNQENTLRSQEFIEKIQQLNKEKMEIQEENVYNIEHNGRIEEAMVQMKREIQSLKEYNKKLLNIQKQSVKIINKYKDEINRQEQEIKNYQKNQQIIKDKLVQYEIIFSERQKQENISHKENDFLLSKKKQEYSILQIQLHSKNKKIQDLQLRTQFQNKKINELEMLLNSQNKQSERLRENIQTVHKNTINLQQQLQKANKKNQEIEVQLSNKTKSEKKTIQQLEKFKRQTNNAFKYLLNILQRDDQADINGKLYPDYELSLMQIQALKKRHSMLTGYKRIIRQLQSNNSFLKKENDTLVKRLQERETQFDQEFKRYKNESRLLLGQNRTENQQLLDKNKLLEQQIIELTSQLEKASIQCNSLKQSMQQLECQFLKIVKEKDQIDEQCSKLEKQLVELQGNFLKQRQRSHSQHSQLQSEISQDLSKLKTQNYELLKKLNNVEKNLKERQVTISKLNSQLQLKEGQNQKTNNNISSTYGKIQQLQREKRQLTRENEKLINQLQSYKQQQTQFQQKILQEKNNIIELHKRIQQLNQIIENQRKKVERIKIENQGNYSRIEFLEKLLNQKENDDKNKNSEKITEQIKDMQQKIIKITSQLEIKEFLALQSENKILELTSSTNNLLIELANKKSQLEDKAKSYSEAQSQRIKMQQQVIRIQNQKNLLVEEIKNNQKRIQELQILIVDYDTIKQELALRQRQLVKLKQQNLKNQKQLQKSMVDLRTSMVNQRKQIVTKGKEQQQQRARIRSLERQLQNKQMDLVIEKKKWETERQQEKKGLITQCQILQLANENLLAQYNNYKDQSLQQIGRLNKDIIELQQLIQDKNIAIQKLTEERDQAKLRIEQVQGQLAYCNESWMQQKQLFKESRKNINLLKNSMSKFEKNAQRLDGVNKQLIQISKQKIKQPPNPSITDRIRQVSTGLLKCKTRILAFTKVEKDKNNILIEFKNVQEIVDLALKQTTCS